MATIRLPPRQLLRPAPVTPSPRAPRALPGVVVQTSALARADAILAELAEIRGRMAAMVHRAGTLLAQLDDPEILSAKGFTRWDELLAASGLPPRPTAARYVAIAQHFTAEEAKQLGVELGAALLRYRREVLGERVAPSQLLRQNPRIAGKRLLEHSASSLGAIVAEHLGERRARADAESDTAAEADAAVRALGPKLRKAGAPAAKLRRVGRGTRCRVRVELDPDEARALAAYLADAARAQKTGPRRT